MCDKDESSPEPVDSEADLRKLEIELKRRELELKDAELISLRAPLFRKPTFWAPTSAVLIALAAFLGAFLPGYFDQRRDALTKELASLNQQKEDVENEKAEAERTLWIIRKEKELILKANAESQAALRDAERERERLREHSAKLQHHLKLQSQLALKWTKDIEETISAIKNNITHDQRFTAALNVSLKVMLAELGKTIQSHESSVVFWETIIAVESGNTYGDDGENPK